MKGVMFSRSIRGFYGRNTASCGREAERLRKATLSTDVRGRVAALLQKPYVPPPVGGYVRPGKSDYDAIIVGGGHNGLISAAYLAKEGLKVLVLEQRHCVGGAAVTEEVVPGFKFSRASYLAGLLRPHIIKDLELEKYGFQYLPRDPSSFTPTLLNSPYKGKYLLLGSDESKNHASIAQFSKHDADAYPVYEEFLNSVREIITPLLDAPPPDLLEGKFTEKWRTLGTLEKLVTVGLKHRKTIVPFYELFTGPAEQLLNKYFDSEILKTTLATDSVIGAMISPKQNGSAYVLLHHVMGEAAGKKGVWAYLKGGMGELSESVRKAGEKWGVEVRTSAKVQKILVGADGRAEGVVVKGVGSDSGEEVKITSKVVMSGISPYHTFTQLLPADRLPKDFVRHIQTSDMSCGAFKINLAVDRLPNFRTIPNLPDNSPLPHHHGTIHFETDMDMLHTSYLQASMGVPATRPLVEMTIPSAIDTTLAPKGKHVVQLFVQYAPYTLHPDPSLHSHVLPYLPNAHTQAAVAHAQASPSWANPAYKQGFVDRVLDVVEEHVEGFRASIIGGEALSPLDLEQTFSLPRGCIHHSSLSLHQLAYARPAPSYSSYRSPIPGLYVCGAGAHPGGGVMGAPGHNAAQVVLSDLKSY